MANGACDSTGVLVNISAPPYEVHCLPSHIFLSQGTYILGRSKKETSIVLNLIPADLNLARETKPTISRKHAEIKVLEDGTVTVKDLGSTNGIFHNNRKVLEATLHHNDTLQFGGASGVAVGTSFSGNAANALYRYEVTGQASSPSPPKKRTVATRGESSASSPQNKGKKPKTTSATIRANDSTQICQETLASVIEANEAEITLLQSKLTRQEASAQMKIKEVEGQLQESLMELSDLKTRYRLDLEKKANKIQELESQLKEHEDKNNQRNLENQSLLEGEVDGMECRKNEPQNVTSTKSSKNGEVDENGAQLLLSSLQRELICPLCKDLLLDAVVVPCSHAFCFLCWHGYCSQTHGNTRGGNSTNNPKCPVCTQQFGIQGTTLKSNHSHRSMHIDNVVTALMDYGSAGESQSRKWDLRVKKAEAKVLKLGLQEVLSTQKGEPNQSPQKPHLPATPRKSSQADNDKQQQVRRRSSSGMSAFCEGCNEQGHSFEVCPHRSDSALEERSDSSSEDEED